MQRHADVQRLDQTLLVVHHDDGGL